MSVFFNFHGFQIEVTSADATQLDDFTRDFAYFKVPGASGERNLHIEARIEEPPYENLPSLRASFITPRNVCYRDNTRMIIDYFGRGLAIWDRAEKTCVMSSPNPLLLHEMVYLFILSVVGQKLDAMGLHRVHALGVSHKGHGIVLMLPSGGGKSTTALGLRNEKDFMLLGEDTPIIDQKGFLCPFPLRLGVRVGESTGIDPKYLRTVPRMEFDPKTLVDIDYFAGRIGGPAPVEMLMIGERNLGTISEIVPTSKLDAFRELFKNLVVGLGVYQGLEFLLEHGLADALGQAGVGLSRLWRALLLVRKAKAYRFRMGRDRDKNFRTLVDFASKTLP